MPDPQAVEVGDQAVAQDAVANPDEPDPGIGFQDGGGDGQNVIVSLEIEEAGNRCEGDLVISQPQLAANFIDEGDRGSEMRRHPCRCRR